MQKHKMCVLCTFLPRRVHFPVFVSNSLVFPLSLNTVMWFQESLLAVRSLQCFYLISFCVHYWISLSFFLACFKKRNQYHEAVNWPGHPCSSPLGLERLWGRQTALRQWVKPRHGLFAFSLHGPLHLPSTGREKEASFLSWPHIVLFYIFFPFKAPWPKADCIWSRNPCSNTFPCAHCHHVPTLSCITCTLLVGQSVTHVKRWTLKDNV